MVSKDLRRAAGAFFAKSLAPKGLGYLYDAIIVTAKQTQPADKANHKIDFDVSFIFLFPLFNIF